MNTILWLIFCSASCSVSSVFLNFLNFYSIRFLWVVFLREWKTPSPHQICTEVFWSSPDGNVSSRYSQCPHASGVLSSSLSGTEHWFPARAIWKRFFRGLFICSFWMLNFRANTTCLHWTLMPVVVRWWIYDFLCSLDVLYPSLPCFFPPNSISDFSRKSRWGLSSSF